MLNRLRDWLHRRVERQFACPTCGMRDSDWLVWVDEGEAVECGRCGTRYTLEGI